MNSEKRNALLRSPGGTVFVLSRLFNTYTTVLRTPGPHPAHRVAMPTICEQLGRAESWCGAWLAWMLLWCLRWSTPDQYITVSRHAWLDVAALRMDTYDQGWFCIAWDVFLARLYCAAYRWPHPTIIVPNCSVPRAILDWFGLMPTALERRPHQHGDPGLVLSGDRFRALCPSSTHPCHVPGSLVITGERVLHEYRRINEFQWIRGARLFTFDLDHDRKEVSYHSESYLYASSKWRPGGP